MGRRRVRAGRRQEHEGQRLPDAPGLAGGESEAEVSRVVGEVADGDVEEAEEGEEREAEVAGHTVDAWGVDRIGVEAAADEVAAGGDTEGVARQAYAATEEQGAAVVGAAEEDDGAARDRVMAMELIHHNALAGAERGLHGTCGHSIAPDAKTPD